MILTFTTEELANLLGTVLGVVNLHSHGHNNSPGQNEEDLEDDTSEEEEDPEIDNGCQHCQQNGDLDDVGERGEEDGDLELQEAGMKRDPCETPTQPPKPAAVRAAVIPLTKILVLFCGLFFHNVFVGMALGIADNDKNLFIAIIFHQFFEGLALGAHMTPVRKLKRLVGVCVVGLVFALEVPAGIAIGLITKSSLEEGSKGYDIAHGTFQGLSGGILIYVSLVHLIKAYMDSGATGWRLETHRLVSYLGFLLGTGVMAVLGIWA